MDNNTPPEFICPITLDIINDPVIDRQGVTYERAAIEHWLSLGNTTSPANNTPLTIHDLRPNISLRNQIERYKNGLDILDKSDNEEEQEQDNNDDYVLNSDEININIRCVKDDDNILLTLKPPNGNGRVPCNICAVVDVSSSMNSEASIKTSDNDVESYGLSILDIVKHSLKTIVHGLTKDDTFTLVTFSNNAKVICKMVSMSKENRENVLNMIHNLEARGMTNLWDGLQKAMNIINHNTSSKNSSIYVLTDGMPNISPPRGESHALEKYISRNSLPCHINMVGFGYKIDSVLLQKLSSQTNGSFMFIPDCGMVGTVFINAIANELITVVNNVRVSVNGTELAIGSIQFGQTRDILLPRTDNDVLNIKVKYNIGNEEIVLEDSVNISESTGTDLIENRIRLNLVENVKRIMSEYPAGSYTDHRLDTYNSTNNSIIDNYVKDYNGQIKEAFSKNEYYTRWGIHYLLSLCDAYTNQKRNNFKDFGVQNFGGELFNNIMDKLDDIFNGLTPPTPSIKRCKRIIYTPVASMGTFNNSSAPCFHGDCIVNSFNGKIMIKDLTKGTLIKTETGWERVLCIIKTKCKDNLSSLTSLDYGLQITPWHPVKKDGKWRFPNDLNLPVYTDCDYVYNIVMENRSSVVVNDTICCTLGHNLKGDIIGHDYFGTDKVINHLVQMNGWNEGLVELSSDSVIRDECTNLVVGLIQ
jgi:hypothetical protein